MPQALLDQAHLVGEKGVTIVFIRADRPAQHDREIVALEPEAGQCLDAGLTVADVVLARCQQVRQQPEILEGKMAQGDGSLHAAFSRRNAAKRRAGPWIGA